MQLHARCHLTSGGIAHNHTLLTRTCHGSGQSVATAQRLYIGIKTILVRTGHEQADANEQAREAQGEEFDKTAVTINVKHSWEPHQATTYWRAVCDYTNSMTKNAVTFVKQTRLSLSAKSCLCVRLLFIAQINSFVVFWKILQCRFPQHGMVMV